VNADKLHPKGISRRKLLKALAAAAGGVGLGKVLGSSLLRGIAQELDKYVYLPFISKAETPFPGPTAGPTSTSTPTSTPTATPTATPTSTPTATPTSTPTSPPTDSRVVHVHSDAATFWDFGDDYYGDFVDQDVVDAMVDRGVMELTGASSLTQAWQTLVPNYVPGKAIAIKVNFNNCFGCDKCRTDCTDAWEPSIDALIHPINAIIRGLLQAYANFETNDVWVYDATIGYDPPWSGRGVPQVFKDSCLYPGVRFFDQSAYDCSETAGYASADPTAAITWHNPPDIATPPPAQVTDVLVDASYHINMPVMKKHVGVAVTLSFKNHFGSIPNCAPLHDWIMGSGPHNGGTRYNPMVDIYRNPHILGKIVLTVGDALFGNWENNIGKPSPWVTFGDSAPNSLLFSTDPVAIDCVMCDLIDAETWMFSGYDDYLVYAAACGLGTYERGDPWGSGYNQIDYQKIEV